MKRRALLMQALGSISLPALLRAPAYAAAPDFAQVKRGVALSFPRDHGAHPAFRTEWWYLTGWLQRPGAADCGFQITFFRSRTAHDPVNPSRFAPHQLLFAHAALALPERGKLLHAERAARAGSQAARFSTTTTDVLLSGWSLKRDERGQYQSRLEADGFAFDLNFAPRGAPVLQGDGGYSRKGPKPEQTSYYVTEPQLRVQGQLTLGRNAQAVSGRAWLDHEWSSTLLDERASGWDWIGLNFDDGSALTAFRIRTSGGETLWSHASLVDANNRRVSEGEARFTAQRVWTSARSQGVYPVVCEVQCAGRSFLLTPLFEDQEIDARASTGGFYWEGAVTAKVAGVQVGRGYMELTGYAGRVRL